MRNSLVNVMRKSLTAALCAVIFVCFAMPAFLRADKLINLSVRANNTDPGIGDIVTVSITADNFPQIVRFGPVKLHYDDEQLEYINVELGSEILGFVFNVSQDTDFINVSAVNQYFQENGTEDGNTSAPDQIVDLSTNMILLSISFRVRQGASGQIPFWIDNPGTFVDADGSNVSTVVDNSISVTISDRVSDDADLVMLKINAADLDQTFTPDVTEYTATVERQVTDVAVTANPSNLWAAVVINGNNNLQVGLNTITVTVTAQDGVTRKEYKINVIRKESYIPDNAVLADLNGVSYTFVDVPNGITVPDGFTQKIRTVNEFTVPAFVKDGVSSVLLYLYDGENPPGLYLYNSDLKTVIPFDMNKTTIRKSSILIAAEIPEDVVIPKGFVEAVAEIGGMSYNGYVNEESVFICYLMDETGKCDFYSYDELDNLFVRFVPVDRTAEVTYNALMKVFMILTAFETLFLIVIVSIVHRVLSRRKNPRPRHV
ncbi:MAG: cadherin-like beta sandwich domain-containing protein [Saccharofermentans sp.]|nr:cadherin-like beta sandwich domain-containing protein [Saccharofermentans sp.]